MGLRCLLGHDFDEPELRREREEEGDEVVTTVREVKTCARCGETQIVSENTEVTTMEQLTDEAAAEADAEPAGGPTATADATGDSRTAPSTEPGPGDDGPPVSAEPAPTDGDDAVILDDGPASDDASAPDGPTSDGDGEPGAAETLAADEGAELIDDGDETTGEAPADGRGGSADEAVESSGSPSGEAGSAEEAAADDGVILDEEGDPGDGRERGAWPAVEEREDGTGGATPWPEHRGEDEGFSAEAGGEGEAGDVEFGGGLTPESAGDVEPGEDGVDGAETEYVEAPDDSEAVAFDAGSGGVETGITRGESPDFEATSDDEETEHYCPECGMVRTAAGSSMRAGDICPECKRGYVDERPR